MINGMMLLKICDPGYDSPTLKDFSMGFAVVSISGIFYQPLMYNLIATGTEVTNLLYHLVLGVFFLVAALVGRAMLRKTNPENYV